MAIFRIEASKGSFLVKGQEHTRLSDETIYYIYASTRDDAISLAKRFVGDKIGHSADRLEYAIVDGIEGWFE